MEEKIKEILHRYHGDSIALEQIMQLFNEAIRGALEKQAHDNEILVNTILDEIDIKKNLE